VKTPPPSALVSEASSLDASQESWAAQPPLLLDDENVMWGAENCNAYPEPDMMVDLDQMDWIPSVMRHICSHMKGCRSLNAAGRIAPRWAMVFFWAGALWVWHAAGA
jgi:hypothetical protein